MNRLVVKSNRGGTVAVQRERAVATCAALIASARALFTDPGYNATGTSDVVARAAVTRGALYHHFADKEELFEAVFRQVLEDLNQQATTAVSGLSGRLWAQVVAAFETYLSLIAGSLEFQRILLIDGPAVLGWRRWRDLQTECTTSRTAEALRKLMRKGLVDERPPEPLANLVQAALNDAALSIAHAADPRAAAAEATDAFVFLLEGLRTRREAPASAMPVSPRQGNLEVGRS